MNKVALIAVLLAFSAVSQAKHITLNCQPQESDEGVYYEDVKLVLEKNILSLDSDNYGSLVEQTIIVSSSTNETLEIVKFLHYPKHATDQELRGTFDIGDIGSVSVTLLYDENREETVAIFEVGTDGGATVNVYRCK
ncbi:MAG: hypothetical protein LW875_08075 [Proteobacteria bacterium]|jgi:hypothetical protein|nr:hypothetical protein [Pseudomonadota bacterium]